MQSDDLSVSLRPSGAEWKRVKPIIGRFQFVKHHPRELLNRMLHLVKSGLQWRMLPAGFPPWQTVYYHFRKWQRQNLFQRLIDRIRRATSRGRRPKTLSQCRDRLSASRSQPAAKAA